MNRDVSIPTEISGAPGGNVDNEQTDHNDNTNDINANKRNDATANNNEETENDRSRRTDGSEGRRHEQQQHQQQQHQQQQRSLTFTGAARSLHEVARTVAMEHAWKVSNRASTVAAVAAPRGDGGNDSGSGSLTNSPTGRGFQATTRTTTAVSGVPAPSFLGGSVPSNLAEVVGKALLADGSGQDGSIDSHDDEDADDLKAVSSSTAKRSVTNTPNRTMSSSDAVAGVGGDTLSTESNEDTPDETMSKRKRKRMEQAKMTEEERRAERRAANRRSAFESRQRRKILIEDLQETVQRFSKENAGLRKEVDTLRQALEEARRENTQLQLNQRLQGTIGSGVGNVAGGGTRTGGGMPSPMPPSTTSNMQDSNLSQLHPQFGNISGAPG